MFVAIDRRSKFAFARVDAGQQVLTIVPRLIATLLGDDTGPPVGPAVWGDTRLAMPDAPSGGFRDIFTGASVGVEGSNGVPSVAVADLLGHYPVAVLYGGEAV